MFGCSGLGVASHRRHRLCQGSAVLADGQRLFPDKAVQVLRIGSATSVNFEARVAVTFHFCSRTD